MRFFDLTLNTTAEKIKSYQDETKKVHLRDYDYESPVGAVSCYLYRNLKNGITFIAYREEESSVLCAFSFDEAKDTLDSAYAHLLEFLNGTFGIKRISAEPCEITPQDYYDRLTEAKRRYSSTFWLKIIDITHLIYYHDTAISERAEFRYKLYEKIISEKRKICTALYDKSVLGELAKIEAHKSASELKVNLTHYFIAAKSPEAASDITEAVAQKLIKANRLSGRRIEMITEIDPHLFDTRHHLEEIIENNFGGVIVFDLSEKFGTDSVNYTMTCKYIEKLVKLYKNNCLFVFTYNPDAPGFAYELLSSLGNYILPVRLKEGTGSKKAAVKYLKELINHSEFAEYASQAGEFLKEFPEDEFSQTDVLTAFDQFGRWSLCRNVLNIDDFDPLEEFYLERDDEREHSPFEELQKLIGLGAVKEQINNVIATDIVEKERKKRMGKNYETGAMHMVFAGNPGTAKTTVARLFAGIAKDKGVLKSGAFVMCGGMDLDGFGVIYKIRAAFAKAKGGVLFIDEAYSMMSDIAVTVLIQEMENHREDVIVILAGYNKRMNDFIKLNEGLKSRVPYWINFPDYSVGELEDIFKLMAKNRGFTLEDGAVSKARSIFERARCMDNFGNGRFARNLLDRALQNQSVRLLSTGRSAEKISRKELFSITESDISMLGEDIKAVETELGRARRELGEMIGLSSVKAILNKVIASFKLKKLCMDKGLRRENPSLHMSFTGNPGTAKTTVARLFAEIMRDEKILPSGKFVEAGRADLVSNYVGGTAKAVKAKFEEAQGGVLFIDEAYSLCDDRENSFGDEAINTIVQEMENHRSDVIVIFAGYSDKMKAFLNRNPGMSSRIAFHVEFEDYTTDELCEITRLLLTRKGLSITEPAMDKLREIYKNAKADSGFGNGRFVRKILEEAEMNLAERVTELSGESLTTELLTTIEEDDISEPKKASKPAQAPRIGF